MIAKIEDLFCVISTLLFGGFLPITSIAVRLLLERPASTAAPGI
jgi:hypothetical protein